MTTTQLKTKVKERLKEDKSFINKLIDKAIKSGCMDIDGADNNYLLPKQLLSAIYKEMSFQYMPLNNDSKQRAEVENIYRSL